MQLTRPQQKFLFLLGISVLYLGLVAWLDFLQGPYWHDEASFWETSLSFSNKIPPSIADLSDYDELNTPLPFVVFGTLEHFFGQGIAAGRLLNLVLSLVMIFIIGWPSRDKGGRAILCLVGLFLCPYYLWLSGRLYTEMIACFWVVMGLMGHLRGRYIWSGVAFVLAISTRQYMLAFPAAVATYEFIVALINVRQTGQIDWRQQWRWIAPGLAACSILGWFYLFGGLAPATAYITSDDAPEVQRSALGMNLGGAIHFLAFVGLYIVIPEFLLFQPLTKLQRWRQQWPHQRVRFAAIALSLLVFTLVFPPQVFASGNVAKVATMMPSEGLRLGFYYLLSLLACLRFSRPSLMGLIVFFSAVIMTKAHPWDRYVLPVVVAFWYLKSAGVVDQFLIFPSRADSAPRADDLSTADMS